MWLKLTWKTRIFCRSSHPDMFCKKSALKYLAKLTGKHVSRNLFFKKKKSGYRPANLFNKRLMRRFFFCEIFRTFSEKLFYSTAVIRCLWFNWILGNFDHLRFTPIPENFDHHSWFYRKYLKFWRSYETIWKPYLEHDIA